MWAVDEVVESPKIEYRAETSVPFGDSEVAGVKPTAPLMGWDQFHCVFLQERRYFFLQG